MNSESPDGRLATAGAMCVVVPKAVGVERLGLEARRPSAIAERPVELLLGQRPHKLRIVWQHADLGVGNLDSDPREAPSRRRELGVAVLVCRFRIAAAVVTPS